MSHTLSIFAILLLCIICHCMAKEFTVLDTCAIHSRDGSVRYDFSQIPQYVVK
jgi:hypothetical protein